MGDEFSLGPIFVLYFIFIFFVICYCGEEVSIINVVVVKGFIEFELFVLEGDRVESLKFSVKDTDGTMSWPMNHEHELRQPFVGCV